MRNFPFLGIGAWLPDGLVYNSGENRQLVSEGLLSVRYYIFTRCAILLHPCPRLFDQYAPSGLTAQKADIQKTIYDNAKSHFLGNFPDSLPIEQAYVHIGMYLGWIID